MNDFSFFWHDYETFGRNPRRDRPSQFAGVRTDADLNEIDAPVQLYCQPAPDFLPEPEACLLTGILPQHCLAHGVIETRFADAIEHELARPGTVGVGYNSIRFDDEVTRFLFWRNLLDPYAREWQNGCGRWDLMDAVRCARALRPQGLNWPLYDDGKPSLRLEDLTRANHIAHVGAHDALADVRATIGLARQLRQAQPRLWAFCLRLRQKDAVLQEMGVELNRPFLHISSRYPPERGCMALVWPLAPHPQRKNEVIVWDLAQDPSLLFGLNASEVKQRLFTRSEDLPEGVSRLPIKTIHLNRSPIVVGNLKTLSAEQAALWGLDLDQGLRHADVAAAGAKRMAGIWLEVYEPAAREEPSDVDEDLYGGFLSHDDRRTLQRLRGLTPAALATKHPSFSDERLEELVFRYRARNYPDTLSLEERSRWQAHCAARLHGGGAGAATLAQFIERIDVLSESADERGQELLGALVDYATGIAPEGV